MRRGFSLENKVHKIDLLEAVLARLEELNNKSAVSAPFDARADAGYGKLNPDKQLSRQQNSDFPYLTPDQYDLDDVEDSDEEELVRSKSVSYITNDPYAGSAVNPFYFVGGNTKLSDCFNRPDDVLMEISAMQSSMGNFRRTGSQRGYTSPPPPSKIAVQLDAERNLDDGEPEVQDFEHALKIMRDTERSEEA